MRVQLWIKNVELTTLYLLYCLQIFGFLFIAILGSVLLKTYKNC